MFMGINENFVKEKGGYNTAKEILQQPRVFDDLRRMLKEREEEINAFLTGLYQYDDYRIIITGAGSSEFAGAAVVPLLRGKHRYIESIGTTTLTASPHLYFSDADLPTLVVSLARSGDSPESVACVDLADKCLNNVFHLVITCNKDGKLYDLRQRENVCAVLMPEGTNDRGFAMTSSVTSMLLAGYIILSREMYSVYDGDMDELSAKAESFLIGCDEKFIRLATSGYGRIVYLGSDSGEAVSREGALKILELTDGRISSLYATPMGFRHGPKSFMDKDTLVIMLMSQTSHTFQYELDVLKELTSQNRGGVVATLVAGENAAKTAELYCDNVFSMTPERFKKEIFVSVLYLTAVQTIAWLKSFSMNCNVDSPCEDDIVNRVVKGVEIYDYSVISEEQDVKS